MRNARASSSVSCRSTSASSRASTASRAARTSISRPAACSRWLVSTPLMTVGIISAARTTATRPAVIHRPRTILMKEETLDADVSGPVSDCRPATSALELCRFALPLFSSWRGKSGCHVRSHRDSSSIARPSRPVPKHFKFGFSLIREPAGGARAHPLIISVASRHGKTPSGGVMDATPRFESSSPFNPWSCRTPVRGWRQRSTTREGTRMRFRQTIVVLDAPDLAAESAFWAGLLEGEVHAEDDWHSVRVDGELRFGIQLAPDSSRPCGRAMARGSSSRSTWTSTSTTSPRAASACSPSAAACSSPRRTRPRPTASTCTRIRRGTRSACACRAGNERRVGTETATFSEAHVRHHGVRQGDEHT